MSNLQEAYRYSLGIKEGGDLQQALTKLPISFPWSRFKGELHLPGHNFTGTGTNLDKRLDVNDTPRNDSKPINRIDEAAYKHDLKYRDHSDIKSRHQADKEMIEELDNISSPTFRERVERMLVKKALQAKMFIGQGGTSSATSSATYAEERHKQFRKPRHTLKVKVFNKDDIWSADLIDMPSESGYRYCLTIIDLYTRYAWVVPLKRKTANEVREAFEKTFKDSGRKPKRLWCDHGKEFYNKQVKPLFDEVYSTENEGKAVVIERFNRTLKGMLFKKFTEQNSQRWIKILPKIVSKYNNKIHSSIGVTPAEASKDPTIARAVRDKIMQNNMENENNSQLQNKKPKFKVGDRVRIFKWKNRFEKGYKGYWTSEIFQVEEVLSTFPVTYKIKDLDNEEITGRFYENELQKTEL